MMDRWLREALPLSMYVRAREARPLAVLAQCARSECLHLERAPGARSIGEEFFETTILVH